MSCNLLHPIYNLQHAWQTTNTVWGKLSIMALYSFLWVSIVLAIQEFVAPMALGEECYFSKQSDYSIYNAIMMQREGNVFAIGFLLYANNGGIKVWNVAMVFLFVLWYGLVMLKALAVFPTLDGFPGCDEYNDKISFWFFVGWPGLALVFAILEAQHGSSSTDATTTTNAAAAMTTSSESRLLVT